MTLNLDVIAVVLLSILALSSKKAIEVMIEREYGGWAYGLARLMVQLAGRICSSHWLQWRADLAFVQKEEGRSGLPEALGCLMSSPGLALKAGLMARRGEPLPAVERPAEIVRYEYPEGEVVYDALKAAYLDLPRLMQTLESERYTGYVRLLTDNGGGHITFVAGVPTEYVYYVGADVVRGNAAYADLLSAVAHGTGVIDIVGTNEAVRLVSGGSRVAHRSLIRSGVARAASMAARLLRSGPVSTNRLLLTPVTAEDWDRWERGEELPPTSILLAFAKLWRAQGDESAASMLEAAARGENPQAWAVAMQPRRKRMRRARRRRGN